ncbi:MAG: Bcr/CflA family drug resistance efflux transporter, partial [Muribaculaceae bacterium]|nr:Bcr/CflA family drug resistance efflux transporter [Muribaculaceae bacterium]
LCSVWLKESLPEEKRIKEGVGQLIRSFTGLFKVKSFVIYVILSGFANGVLFSYISSASFVIQTHFGYSELIFSLIFAVNAIGIGVGSAIAIKFRNLRNATLAGSIIMLACGVVQYAETMILDSFISYELTMLLIVLGLGLLLSSSTTLAMDEGRQSPGSASAIFGAVGFLFGGIVSPIVGIGEIIQTSSILIIICAAICFVLSIVSVRGSNGNNYLSVR